MKINIDIANEIGNIIRAETDDVFWTKNNLGISLYQNQIEIEKAVLNINIPQIAIIQARQGGKTSSIACSIIQAAAKNIFNRKDGTQILVFANKEEQVNIDRDRCWGYIHANQDKFKGIIDFKSSIKKNIRFLNKSSIRFETANPLAHMEGLTGDLIVLDESQRMDDEVISKVIIPMGSARNAKIVQIGTPRGRNHFYHAANDKDYLKIQHDWTQCPNLWENGKTMINGKEYSSYVLKQMPRKIWMELFPDNSNLWHDGNMAEEDFRTEYLLEWLLDVYSALTETERNLIIEGSDFKILKKGNISEKYIAGIDFAGGAQVQPGDATSISVWRIDPTGIFQKVYAYEMIGEDWNDQEKQILKILHPKTGLFPCKKIAADYTTVGIFPVDYLKGKGLPIIGINFSKTNLLSGKNNKNTIFDNFKLLLNHKRIKYPIDTNKNIIMRNHYLQWCQLESHQSRGINRKLIHPPDEHDDGVDSDMLAIWAATEGIGLYSKFTSGRMKGVLVRRNNLRRNYRGYYSH